MMREHGRYKLSSAIVAVILSYVLLVALIFIVLILALVAAVQLGNYL